MDALFAAFSGLDVGLKRSRPQMEPIGPRLGSDPIGRSSERLAVCAMTDPNCVGINLGRKGNLSTVTAAFDIHGAPQ